MTQAIKRELKPRLRFPEFLDAGEWEVKPLGKVCDIKGGKRVPKGASLTNEKTGYPYIRVTDMYMGGINASSVLFINSEIEKKIRNYKISKNDLFITVAGTIGIVGEVPKELDNANLTENANKIVLKSISKNYLLNYLIGESVQKQISSSVTNNAQPKLALERIRLFPIQFPSKPEQKKIADCLSSIDELITAQTQKVATLKTHKKGLMQQLFPAEGETLPKLRFPEFQDAPEWEPLPIGKKVDLLSGYPFDGIDISENSCGTRLLRGINITEGRIRHSKDIDRYYFADTAGLEKYNLKKNDLVIGMDGSKVGKNVALITSSDIGALLVQRVARLRSDCVISIQFIFQQINSNKFHAYVDRINTSSGIPHISAKQINDFQISFPSINEQQKIADCLSSLDDLITAQTQKLSTLKIHKKALMQQLFPTIDEVSS